MSAFKNETFDMIASERDCGFGKAVQTTDSEDEQEVKDIAANTVTLPSHSFLSINLSPSHF